MLEKHIQRKILNYLEEKMFEGKCVVARTHSGVFNLAGGGYAHCAIAGYPDITLLYKGKFYGIEVKQEKGKQSEDQKRMEKWITQCGGIYLIARNLKDISDLIS